MNPDLFIFDIEALDGRGELVVRHQIPFTTADLPDATRQRCYGDGPIEYSHTLTEQEPVERVPEDFRRWLGRADLTRQDQDVRERLHPEVGQQRTGVLGAVADDRDLDAAGLEHLEKRDRVVVEPRGREQEFPVSVHERAHEVRPRLDAALPQHPPEAASPRQRNATS
jgi:hypothetical protein